ncbi:MAG: hypothetical protein ACYDDF_11780 [Thermoplasmatota archaeon]
MPRKRANPPPRWWRNKKKVAKVLRAGILVTFLVVAGLAVVNFFATSSNKGPLGLNLTTWLFVSTGLLIAAGVFMLLSISWLRKYNELPRENANAGKR